MRSLRYVALVFALGCTGRIHDPVGVDGIGTDQDRFPPGSGGTADQDPFLPGDREVPDSPPGTPPPASSCTPGLTAPGVPILRRLSHTEYNNTLVDLFSGFEITPRRLAE